MNFKKIPLALPISILLWVGNACAAEKSIWQSFVDFFSPTPAVEGEGPLYDELRNLDSKINRVEGQYSRERRPMNKNRYKKELAELQKERELLLKKIEESERKSSAAISPSESVESSSSMTSTVPVSGISSGTLCKSDTVYIRDTVVVHDTLYVMLAPKPVAAPVEENMNALENSASSDSVGSSASVEAP